MTLEQYMSYLLSSPTGSSCVQAAQVLEVSHEEVNRFLLQGNYSGKDLYEKAVVHLVAQGGTLSVDDSVLDKPYSQQETSLITYLYSGKHHRTVKGYASTANFKFLRNQELSFLFAIEKNRIISTQPGQYQQVSTANIPQEGLYTHLKEFDFVKVFQTVDKDNDVRYYVYYHPDEHARRCLTRTDFEKAHQQHWQIEVFHRTCKQVCNIEHFFVRTASSIRTHLFAALRAFIRLTALVKDQFIDSFYALHRQLFLQAQREFILNFA
jgi:hypothetical protein